MRRAARRIGTWIATVSLLLGCAPAAWAQDQSAEPDPPSFLESLTGGSAGVRLYYRFEFVDEEAFADSGYASTLRTVLHYGTRPFHGFRVYLEAENVTDVGFADSHNNLGGGDSGNGVVDRPAIADPPGTEMLQAFGEYTRAGTRLRAGRQVINLDDQRHVGAVGWRQHWQTHDAVRLDNESLEDFSAHYAYLYKNRDIRRRTFDTGSHLINAQYRFDGVGALTAYAYLLRYDDPGARVRSRDTFGGEFKGARDIDDLTLHYELEYAHQADADNNPARVDSDYLHLMGGLGYGAFTVRIGWERIDGSARDGQFQFVLGTNHAFNGWVDKFLATPRDGLSDLMVRLDGPLGPVRWQLRYHDFNAVSGDARYGSEVDFLFTYTAPWEQTFGLKGGFYDADEFSTDTTKIWAFTGFSF